MLFKPLLATDLSGKVGGLVASHNAGGAYFRAATIPTNPNTPFQQAVRGFLSTLTAAWNDVATPGERVSWETYAANVLITNRIGEQVNISGLAHYVRSNVPRLQAGLARVDSAPTVYNLGVSSQPSFDNATEAAQTVDASFFVSALTDPWANATGGAMLVYVSRPQNQSVVFFKGPYRFAAAILGDAVPPTSPEAVNAQFPFVEGQKVFLRTIVTQVDGRLGGEFRGNTLAVA